MCVCVCVCVCVHMCVMSKVTSTVSKGCDLLQLHCDPLGFQQELPDIVINMDVFLLLCPCHVTSTAHICTQFVKCIMLMVVDVLYKSSLLF